MNTITAIMGKDHQQCDQLFAASEAALDQSEDFGPLKDFIHHMKQHFSAEEDVLFPAFEELTGMRDRGPSAMMRLEHEQMRGLMSEMESCTDAEQASNLGETLMILMQQHNLKEENMLYPMLDQHFQLDQFKESLISLLGPWDAAT